MNGYLLDTSVCISLFRGNKEIEKKVNEIGSKNIFICDVVLAELRYGAFNSGFVEENLRLIDSFVKEVKVIPFFECIDTYAQEKVRLRKEGKMIEDFDLLIGCSAKAVGLTMVTGNIKHFNHISGLNVESWIE